MNFPSLRLGSILKNSQNRQSLNQRRCGEKTRPSATEMLGNFAEFHLNCHRKNNLAKVWFSSSKSKKNNNLQLRVAVFFYIGVVSLLMHWQYASPMPLPEDLPVRLRHDGPLSRPCIGCVDVHTYIVTSIVCTIYHAWCGIDCCVSYQQKTLKTTTSRLNVYIIWKDAEKKSRNSPSNVLLSFQGRKLLISSNLAHTSVARKVRSPPRCRG